jgi:hypothetical protein
MLQFVLTAPPQDHEPSISSTISLPICEPLSISPTSYRNSPMGPPPSILFSQSFFPPWGTHFTLGHPFLYLYIFSQIISLLLVQTPVFYSHLPLSSPLAACLPFGHTQPMSPLVGALLIIHPHRHRLYLQITTQVTYPLSSEFTYLVPPLAQLTSDLVVPMTLDLVPTVAATPSIMHPPTKGSLESSHFLTSSIYLCHLITSVDSTEYLLASGSRVTFLSTSAYFSKRATVSWSSFPIQMSDLGRHSGKHHSSLMSLTPITFDANTFSCCGGSYFATIAVFYHHLSKTSELGRATTAHITVVVYFRDHYHWFRVCSFAELSSAFIIPPLRALQSSTSTIHTFSLQGYITRAWGMPASLIHICILFHTLWKVGSTGSSLLQRIAL